MTCNVEELTNEELESLIQTAKNQIENRNSKTRAEAISEIKAIAKQHGLSIEITNEKDRRAKVAIKYRDGENTWSGRGLKPKWLQERLSQGRSLEEFRV